MRVFLDANILIDKFDSTRIFHKFSDKSFEYMLLSGSIDVFTSCDIITTLYYIGSKKDKKQILHDIRAVNKTLEVIKFSNKEIEETCELMINDNNYKDLEDTIQYIMAKKENCDLIISNDKNFISKDIKLLTSEEFYNQYVEGEK
ncbi:MAG: type II toxin-antitoxin system VapC family toxin [Campylobacteraceae bacterium]|nr:type II toxin-antitoxin system VapC family toxin [Campylobacteraceae bacterium]MBT7116825.1 type II toxin-antitoxin system VapC family toxin [Campylobacteraceae bacterium]